MKQGRYESEDLVKKLAIINSKKEQEELIDIELQSECFKNRTNSYLLENSHYLELLFLKNKLITKLMNDSSSDRFPDYFEKYSEFVNQQFAYINSKLND
jgi:hypothetical protein